MERALISPQPRDKERGWLSRIFSSKRPFVEKPAPEPEVSGVRYDPDTKRHLAKDPSHQPVLDIFDGWRAISHGTFTDAREFAVFGLFGITDVAERVREYSRNVCPSYAAGLELSAYTGRTREIMEHTASLHLNRSGLDHFGVPVFDFQLLSAERRMDALADIRRSILSAIERRKGLDADASRAYYLFQGMRMLRHLESLHVGENDWRGLSAAFPGVPIPGPLNTETDLAETEALEVKAFRTYINKRSYGSG